MNQLQEYGGFYDLGGIAGGIVANQAGNHADLVQNIDIQSKNAISLVVSNQVNIIAGGIARGIAGGIAGDIAGDIASAI